MNGITERQLAEVERDRLFDELRLAHDQVKADLEAMTRLHRLGSLFVREGNLEPVLGEIVDAAIAISGADFGNIQLLDEESSDLRIVAHRGFPGWWLKFWNSVAKGQGVCGTALERGERVIVEDVERSPIFAGTPALEIQRNAGVRAVQSTPLLSRSGKPLGMFSTHWRKPGRPDERSLRLLDLLARHAADIAERAQNEKTLLRHRELLQRVFEKIPVLLVMWDPRLQRFTLNRKAEEVLGLSTSEANERDLMSAVYPSAEYRAEAAAYMQSLEPGFREWIGRSKSGEDVPIAWANIRLADETMIGVGVDLRERKRAEEALRESEERFRLLVQGVKDYAIYMLAPDGTVNSWNAGAEQIFGYREEEIVGQLRAHLFTEDGRRSGDPQRSLEEAAATGRCEREGWRVKKDGSRFWANVLISALRDDDGNLRGFANVTRDFTERRRNDELRASEAALREADRQKNQFLAMLSHELRNPLAPIRNSIYLLERAAPGGEHARRAMAVIDRQVGHMTRLIDDLLDVTRIVRGKVRLQWEGLDLNELVQRTVEDHRTLFSKGEIRLEVLAAPAEVRVNGDPVRLSQVIGNLLQNAAKFTPHGGTTIVSVQTDSARGEAAITVSDTGSGIQPEMLPRLFHAFSQADSTLDRSKGGLGLGLALVKGLAEMHGGSVSAASDGPGKGAEFTIRLPLDAAAARAIPSQGVLSGGRGARRRVLVIEDNEDAADTLREVLELCEHVVEVAYSGRSGIEKARSFHPDVVLCDIGLPEIDGYEVARKMRDDPDLCRVALVAVSGYAQPEDVAMAREAGFDAHLTKPPSIEALERALADVRRPRTEPLHGDCGHGPQ